MSEISRPKAAFAVYYMPMRIIAGSKKGMKLLSPKTDVSRPITDRVKESLFNVLYKYDLPAGKCVADLFSGVGSLGLEALSRSAEFVTFVEKDPEIVKILERNIEKAGFVKESKVIRTNAFKFASGIIEGGQNCDIVFVDPPYAATKDVAGNSRLGNLLNTLAEKLNPNSFVVVRTDKQTELFQRYGRLKIIERREWGTMAVTIFSMDR
ncbi:16S rRNA (guanine(966)-N(2))-methyltransferase RsmD [Planctomycetota bacterium]